MDELAEIKAMIETFKETLIFLVEQEKVRGAEVAALNDKIEAVNDTLVNQIINPSLEAYKEEEFGKFNDKYGERLGQYDETIRTAWNDPEYSATREAWKKYQEIPEEKRSDETEAAFISDVEKGLSEYVSNMKRQLGIPEDVATSIEETEDGVQMKADTTGDGVPDQVVAEEPKEEPTEAPAEGEEEEEVDEIDPELKKALENY